MLPHYVNMVVPQGQSWDVLGSMPGVRVLKRNEALSLPFNGVSSIGRDPEVIHYNYI